MPLEYPGRLLRDGYNAWAPAYDRDMAALGYALPVPFTALLRRHLPEPGNRILDAGAGTGLLGARLARMGYRFLVGLDNAPGMLERAERRCVYRGLREMDLSQPLAFPDRAFDGVAALGVINWSHPLPQALEEFVRVTRPGGRVLFSAAVDARGRVCCGAGSQRLRREGRWHFLEASPARAIFTGGPPGARVRLLAYAVA